MDSIKATTQTMSIHQVEERLQQQKDAFLLDPFPNENFRKQQLKALKKSLLKHKEKLIKAVSADFGHRSEDESLLADIMPTVMSIDHTIAHLRDWMRPEKRQVSMLFQPSSNRIMYQPLGVIGIMSPWNYPIFLSLGPLIAAIAAGNRAMIKPSEYTPYANRVLSEIIQEAFAPNEVVMIDGDAEMAAQFSSLAFDHLLFTGSTAIGKKVMASAANNLTPVTLELGGKSPAIIAPDVSADFAVERMLYGKCLNAGQTCVAPDYVLCPSDKLEALIVSFKQRFNQLYPDFNSGDFTCVVNDRQFQRLQNWLQDAQDQGAQIHQLTEVKTKRQRLMPLQLVTQVTDQMLIMQQEIFGPVLPIVCYDSLEQAIQYINQRPRPLALYLFTKNKRTENKILMHTHAGGVSINDTVNHVAQEDLPFGGIGPSGMGKYHAKEGFLTFSAAKSILKRGFFYSAKAAFPPYGRWVHKLIYKFFLH